MNRVTQANKRWMTLHIGYRQPRHYSIEDMGKIAFVNENVVSFSLVMTDVNNRDWDQGKYFSLHDTLEEAKVALLVLLRTRS